MDSFHIWEKSAETVHLGGKPYNTTKGEVIETQVRYSIFQMITHCLLYGDILDFNFGYFVS